MQAQSSAPCTAHTGSSDTPLWYLHGVHPWRQGENRKGVLKRPSSIRSAPLTQHWVTQLGNRVQSPEVPLLRECYLTGDKLESAYSDIKRVYACTHMHMQAHTRNFGILCVLTGHANMQAFRNL